MKHMPCCQCSVDFVVVTVEVGEPLKLCTVSPDSEPPGCSAPLINVSALLKTCWALDSEMSRLQPPLHRFTSPSTFEAASNEPWVPHGAQMRGPQVSD